jgi:hypothetical protein
VSKLGDNVILQGTVIEGNKAAYTCPQSGEVVEREFDGAPKGQQLITFCQEVRGELNERQKSADDKARSEAAAHATTSEGRDTPTADGGGSDWPTPETGTTFEEELRSRLESKVVGIETAELNLVRWKLDLFILNKEKAALEAALNTLTKED